MEDPVDRALNTENYFRQIQCNNEDTNFTGVAISKKNRDPMVTAPLVNLDCQISGLNNLNSAGNNAGECVLVYVRPRPLQKTEQEEEEKPFLLDVEHGKVRQIDGNRKCYEFDGVLHPECSQSELYQRVVQPLTAAVLQGYNATVLAYGQTGSGKTYTMGTAGENSQHKEKEGILQRVLAELLPDNSPRKSTGGKGGKIARRSQRISGKWALQGSPADIRSKNLDATQVLVTPKVSQLLDNDKENTPGAQILLPTVELTFLEIHNEKVYDLLTSARTQLATKPDNAGGVQAANCQQLHVRSRRHGLALVRAAAARRSVAETTNNACSSRSHALVGIKVTRGLVSSVMWLVDLAGSECAGRLNQAALTVSDCGGSSRKVFDEGVAINKGLLALGKVLTARAAKSNHVPYRDSILTHLLRESVSGNSRTAMIACASLSLRHAAHTTTTLRYAEQARDVRTRPTLLPPMSVIKRLSVKRQYEDPTATPAAWKKHSTPAFKTPHHMAVPGKAEGTAGKSRHLSFMKAQLGAASSSVKASKTSLQPSQVILNATVSTPGHTPSARVAKRPLNYSCLGESNRKSVPDGALCKTPRGSHQLFQSLQQPVFEEEESLRPSPGASIFTSLDNLECSVEGAKRNDGPRASSPLQGVSKLLRQSTGRRLRTPDVQAILRPLVTHLEQSMIMAEDRLADKILARLTRSRVKQGLDVSTAKNIPANNLDNSPGTLPTNSKTSSCLTPDLGDTVLDMMLCTSASRAGKKRKFEEALQQLVQKSMRGIGCMYNTQQLEETEVTASQTVVVEEKMSADIPEQLLNKNNGAKGDAGNNFLVPDIPLLNNKCNGKVKCKSKVLNTVSRNDLNLLCSADSTMLCDTVPQNGKPLTSTTYQNNRVIRRSSRMLCLLGQQEIEHDVSCIDKLPGDCDKKSLFVSQAASPDLRRNGSKRRSGTVADHSSPCKIQRLSCDESIQQNLLLGLKNEAQVQLNDTTVLLCDDNIKMKETDRFNGSIFDGSLLSFVPPKHRPAKPIKVLANPAVRRSVRVAALRATELNHTLLCSSSPEVYVRHNRTVRRSNTRTQPAQLTLPTASPTVLKEHQQQVLHLLNTGTLKELQQLPTVGPKTAMVLCNYRTFYGKFSSLATLHQVPGLTKSFVTRFGKANLVHI